VTRRFDLRSLRFGEASETWRSLPVEFPSLVFGGLDYEVPDGVVDAHLTVARVGENLTLTLTVETTLLGPCQRCLCDATIPVEARGVEYARHGESEGDEDAEAYVDHNQVDLERWVRDIVVEALPEKLLCGDGCLGLCPVCGVDLNADPGHRHEEA